MQQEVAVVLTDRAVNDFRHLKTVAEYQVSLGPIPSNVDSRNRYALHLMDHWDQTRQILTSLKSYEAILLDQNLFGKLAPIKYRTESSTCIYYFRTYTRVTVLHICHSPLDHDALYKLIASGNTQVLSMIGLPAPHELPNVNPMRVTIH